MKELLDEGVQDALKIARNPLTSQEELENLMHRFPKSVASNPNISKNAWADLASSHPKEALNNPVHDLYQMEDPSMTSIFDQHGADMPIYADNLYKHSPELSHIADGIISNLNNYQTDYILNDQNPHPKILNILKNSSNEAIKHKVANHPKTTPEILHHLFVNNTQSPRIVGAVLTNKNTSPETLEHAVNKTNLHPDNAWHIAKHQNASPAILDKIASNPNAGYYSHVSVSKNPNTSTESLTNLYKNYSNSADIANALADHPNAHSDVLWDIAGGSDQYLANKAARNLEKREENK